MCSAISGEVFVADHLIDEVYIFCVPCDAQFRKILDFLNHKKSGECTSAIDTINVNKDINFNLAEGNSSTSSAKKLKSVKFTHYKSALICQFGNNDYRTKCIFCESIFGYFSLFLEHFSTCKVEHGGLSNILTNHVIKSEEINIVDDHTVTVDDTKNFDTQNIASLTDNTKNSENIVNAGERLNSHGERPYECEICSFKFKKKNDLNMHNRLVHNGERAVQCDKCQSTFAKKWCLRRHIKNIHWERKSSSSRSSSGRSTRSKSSSENKQRNALNVESPQNNSIIEAAPNVSEPGDSIAQSDINLNSLDLNDPGVWPDLNDKLISHLVEKGPKQIDNILYPVSRSGRKFNSSYFKRFLSNGDTVPRSWLVYSVSKDAIFCFCCKLFKKSSSNPISSSGYNDWNHIGSLLKKHELNSSHFEYFIKWKELELRLSKNSTIDSCLDKNMSKEIQHRRDVLKRLLILVEFLAVQSFAFRGGSDKLFEKNNGNFLKLVEAIAKFDPILSEHLRRINNNETPNKYICGDIQNELIQIISNVIENKMTEMIREAKYYSIILDCTPDQSRKEQLSLIIRILHKNQNSFEIKELFMGFLTETDTTGKGLTDLVLDRLNSMGFLISDCRGQGYDNGSNIKGKNIGMQAQIKNLESRAFFVPCASHSANLVLLDSVQCSAQAVKFFDTVQSLYVFFSGSVSRWEILKKNVTTLTLKPLCTTRWESRVDALKPLIFNLDCIYDALVELTDDKDSLTRHTAEVLGNKILKFDFICSLLIWYNVLDRINIFSKYLEGPAICLTTSVNILQATKQYLVDLRTEDKFQDFVSQAKQIALKLDVPSFFPPPSKLRSRGKAPLFSYEGRDEVILNPEDRFKVEFYFKILDQALQSVTERIEQISEHNNIFKFLHDISMIPSHTSDYLLNNCLNLQKHLTYNNHSDISGLELFEELKIFKTLISNTEKPPSSPIDTLHVIFGKKLESLLPNLIISLKILLTIPVTVASGERSFSKLKIIKNYLRTTMTQDRLVDLATLSIESELLENLNYSDVIDDLAKLKERKVNFI